MEGNNHQRRRRSKASATRRRGPALPAEVFDELAESAATRSSPARCQQFANASKRRALPRRHRERRAVAKDRFGGVLGPASKNSTASPSMSEPWWTWCLST